LSLRAYGNTPLPIAALVEEIAPEYIATIRHDHGTAEVLISGVDDLEYLVEAVQPAAHRTFRQGAA
jgi:hypothetical protein